MPSIYVIGDAGTDVLASDTVSYPPVVRLRRFKSFKVHGPLN